MTTRPGSFGTEWLRLQRSKHLCHLLLIQSKMGRYLALTDHDRQLTVEGRTYKPILLGALSSDRRESGLRTGDQEATVFIDTIELTHLDIQGDAWLGAEVQQTIVDWRQPFIVLARHRRWIRKIVRQGQTFTATLEGRAQQLQRPNGGRFGGYFTTKCQYQLGGQYCRADLSGQTSWEANLDSAATGTFPTLLPTAWSYDWLYDSTRSWIVGQWAPTSTQDWYVQSYSAGVGVNGGQRVRIAWSDVSALYFDKPLLRVPFGSRYAIGRGFSVATGGVVRPRLEFRMNSISQEVNQYYRDGSVLFTSGNNRGLTFAIADYVASNRKITLLTPTPFDIQAGDYAIVTVGCDGLASTCKNKFNNFVNFGGDPHAPSVQTIIEPPREIT